MSAVLWAVITALLWGGAAIIEKTALFRLPPLIAVAVRSAGITFVSLLLLLGLRQGESLRQAPWQSLLLAVCGGLIAGGLGQWTYFNALKQGQVSVVVPIAASFPLVAFILASVILKEPVTIFRLLGVVLVVAGVILLK